MDFATKTAIYNYFQNGNSCVFRQFAFFKDVFDVLVYGRNLGSAAKPFYV